MKKTHYVTQKSARLVMGLFFVATLIFSSCEKAETTVPETAPELPPKSTLVMDFSDFTETDTTYYKSSMSHMHWGRAVTHVLAWNTVITFTLAIPVISFQEAFKHQGIYDPNTGSWVWSYNFFAGGVMHLAELHGSLVEEGVKWEMFISKNNQYTDFLWYSGIANLTNTSGYWELNQNPSNPNEFLYIEWEKDLSDETAEIKYTNVIPGNPGNGSYIYYSVNNDLDYNAYYDIYGSQEDNLINIQWHKTNGNGRIIDEVFFDDTDWRCWDENLLDVSCN